MAEHSGFFDALKDADGNYDRKYRSGDYCDNLAVIISDGVLRSSADDLKPSANGMSVSIGAGRAWVRGHWYYNDNTYTFPAVEAPTGNSRYDRIFLRFDLNVDARSMKLVYVQGAAAATPTKPAPTISDTVRDLCLCDIYVAANATSVVVTDTRGDKDLCGWIYSTSGDGSFFTSLDNQFDLWFEDKKDTLSTTTAEVQYSQYTVLTVETKTVQITIPQYDSTQNQKIAVYVNGIRDVLGEDFTITGSIITFANTLVAGTEIVIYIYVPKNGEGISAFADDVTDLQNRVSALENGLNESTYNYICNGATDNVEISNLVTAFLNGGTDYATLVIHIYGTLGMTAAVAGDGTSANPFRWFSAGLGTSQNRKIILDFGGCSQITVPVAANTYNVVFYGMDAHVKNCGVVANESTANIMMFSTVSNTVVFAENCRFWITAAAGYIAKSGTFKNCRVSLTTATDNAYCFTPENASLLRLIGGEYYAYAPSAKTSAVVYVAASYTEAVANTYSVNCPQVARSGYVQSYAVYCLTNNASCSFTDTITPLSMSAAGQNIRGTIAQNKAGMM